MKLTAILATGLAILTLATPVSAAPVEFQTSFEAKEIILYNDEEQNDLICVTDEEKELLFTALPVSEYVYTTAALHVRENPNILTKPYGILAENSKVRRVGRGAAGWDVIQVNEVNYFVWSEYLTMEAPPEDEIIEVHQIEPKQPGVYFVASQKKNSNADSVKQESSNSKGSYLGSYKLTAYCNCSKCCGKWAGGATASGTTPTAGRTVACNSLPFGTKLNINGHIYTVEDTGNMADNVIDIYFNSHSAALQFGVQYADVYRAN